MKKYLFFFPKESVDINITISFKKHCKRDQCTFFVFKTGALDIDHLFVLLDLQLANFYFLIQIQQDNITQFISYQTHVIFLVMVLTNHTDHVDIEIPTKLKLFQRTFIVRVVFVLLNFKYFFIDLSQNFLVKTFVNESVRLW